MENDNKNTIYEIGSKYSNYSKQGIAGEVKRDASDLLKEMLNQQNKSNKESE